MTIPPSPTSRFKELFPIGWALRQTFKNGYRLKEFKADLTAAFVVSLIALPLSMALSIGIGLPPQHGLYTAIIAGIAAAVFGGSLYQISGPTAAFVVILIPIVADLGLRGIIWCQILAGIILILFGVARLGKLINYVPYPVTTGFTTGIAIVLATIALKDFFGLPIEQLGHHFTEKFSNIVLHLPQLNLAETAIGITTLFLILWSKRSFKFLPAPVIGVVGGTLLGLLLSHFDFAIGTIGSKFSYFNESGSLQQGIPPYPPKLYLPTFSADSLFTLPSWNELKTLISPAFIIAALAALESLLSATIADSLTGTRHQPNAELQGIGIANILSGLATGIPATAAIARTATNIHSGAHSPFAAVFHALFIFSYILLLSPIISFIPMSALAALLLITAYNMSHLRQFKTILRIAPSADRIVLLTCCLLTVLIDMVAGVTVGIVLAAFLFMSRIVQLTNMRLEGNTTLEDEPRPDLPPGVMVFKIEGPLFFGTVEKAYDRTMIINNDVKTLIIDMEKVPFIDMTAMVAMKSLLSTITKNRNVILCGRQEVIDKILKKIPHSLLDRLRTTETINEALQQVTVPFINSATINNSLAHF